MFLFPVDGILEVVLSYGQMISLFLVFVIFEAWIAANPKRQSRVWCLFFWYSCWRSLSALCSTISAFFVFMLIPVAMCLIAFFVARKTREKNIAKGIKYNKDGLIEEELKKMEKN